MTRVRGPSLTVQRIERDRAGLGQTNGDHIILQHSQNTTPPCTQLFCGRSGPVKSDVIGPLHFPLTTPTTIMDFSIYPAKHG